MSRPWWRPSLSFVVVVLPASIRRTDQSWRRRWFTHASRASWCRNNYSNRIGATKPRDWFHYLLKPLPMQRGTWPRTQLSELERSKRSWKPVGGGYSSTFHITHRTPPPKKSKIYGVVWYWTQPSRPLSIGLRTTMATGSPLTNWSLPIAALPTWTTCSPIARFASFRGRKCHHIYD